MHQILSPEIAERRLRDGIGLVAVVVDGTLNLAGVDRCRLVDVVVEGDIRLAKGQRVKHLNFSDVVVTGQVSLGPAEIKNLGFANTVVRGSLFLCGTEITEVLNLHGLTAKAIVVDLKLAIFGRRWEDSANLLRCAAPTIPIIFDLR